MNKGAKLFLVWLVITVASPALGIILLCLGLIVLCVVVIAMALGYGLSGFGT